MPRAGLGKVSAAVCGWQSGGVSADYTPGKQRLLALRSALCRRAEGEWHGEGKDGIETGVEEGPPKPPAARAAASEYVELRKVVKSICLKQEKCGQ